MLDGSTDTQVLNSTDTAAAVRPSSPRGPCLCRGDVQFAAAPHHSSSSSSMAHSSDVDVAASQTVPQTRGASLPCYTRVSSLFTSQPGIYTAGGLACRRCRTSPEPATHLDCQSAAAAAAAMATSRVHAGLYDAVPTSSACTATSTTLRHLPRPVGTSRDPVGTSRGPLGTSRDPVGTSRDPVGTSHIPVLSTVSCGCPQSTTITSSAVTAGLSRPPVTVTSSSSQDTIVIHLERSPRRSAPRDELNVVRGAAASESRLPRRRRRGGDRSSSRRCDRGNEMGDVDRLKSLLTQLKVIVTANHDPEVTRLLTELCEAAGMSSSETQVKAVVSDSSPAADQLQSEVTQLSRLRASSGYVFVLLQVAMI